MAAQDQVPAPIDPTAGIPAAWRGTWTVDTARSTVGLKTKAMWGMVPVKGTFSGVTGQVTVADDGSVSGRLEVPSSSIDTGMKMRDVHLRSDDFFASDKHPTITFEIDRLAPGADGMTADGRLTVRDRTTMLSFPATLAEQGAGVVALDAEVTVDRSTVGIDFKAKGATKMDNTMALHAVFVRA